MFQGYVGVFLECLHIRVSFGTRGVPGARFERRAGGNLD